jgi:adenylate kinase
LPAAILAGNAAGKVDPMNLILLGPPGVGKGTQGRLLAERLDVRWLSSGDILRDAVRGESGLGKQVEQSMRHGDLVADGVILEIMEGRLRRADAMRGFILDGFPRTRGQAEALTGVLDRLGLSLSAAIVLDLPDAEVVRRLSGRRTCPVCGRVYHVEFEPAEHEGHCDVEGAELMQRDDDRPDTIRRRLLVYHREIGPLLDYYEEVGLLHRADGRGAPDDVHERLEVELKEMVT